MKFINIVFVLMASVLFFAGCQTKEYYLSPKDVLDLNMEMKKAKDKQTLVITGQSGSGWGIDKLECSEKNRDLFIRVPLIPEGKDKFNFEISVGNHINRIFWEDNLIWSR